MLSVTKCGWGEVAKPHFDSTIQKGMKHWEPPLGGKKFIPKHISASDLEFRHFF